MASGTNRVYVGSYTGTGALLSITKVGFRPRKVKIINPTGLTVAEWNSEMPDDSAFKQVNHDTTQNAYITSNGIIPLVNGFSVGTDADINTDTEVCMFEAWD